MIENASSDLDTPSGPLNTQLASQRTPTAQGTFMLRPKRAWKMLCARTGGRVSLMTFYRWLKNGKIYSVRIGYRIFVPRSSVEDLIKQCLSGERV